MSLAVEHAQNYRTSLRRSLDHRPQGTLRVTQLHMQYAPSLLSYSILGVQPIFLLFSELCLGLEASSDAWDGHLLALGSSSESRKACGRRMHRHTTPSLTPIDQAGSGYQLQEYRSVG